MKQKKKTTKNTTKQKQKVAIEDTKRKHIFPMDTSIYREMKFIVTEHEVCVI